jgi:hypothetical protein
MLVVVASRPWIILIRHNWEKLTINSQRQNYGKHSRTVISLSLQCKVDVPNSITYLNQTPIFEWHVIRCDSNNISKKTRDWKESGLCAQNLIIILSSTVKSHAHLMHMRIFTMRMYKIFIRAPKIMRKVALASLWICELSRANHVFHILWEVGSSAKVTTTRPHQTQPRLLRVVQRKIIWATCLLPTTRLDMLLIPSSHTYQTFRDYDSTLTQYKDEGKDTLSWQRPNSDPYNITTKWLAVNLKLLGTSHG